MLSIDAVDGCKYLINKRYISFIKSNGNKVYIYIPEMDHPIVSSMSFDELAAQVSYKLRVVDSMNYSEERPTIPTAWGVG